MRGECHAHIKLSGIPAPDVPAFLSSGNAERVVRDALFAYRDREISFVRDGGDKYGVSLLAKQIAPEYGIDYRSPVFAIFPEGYYGGIIGKSFRDIGEYRALIREVSERGGDFIKLIASGILDFSVYGAVSPSPVGFEALFGEMVHVAHEEGFRVMVHANLSSQISMALETGCDSIEHGFYMDDACLALLKERNAVWVPTLHACELFQGKSDCCAVRRIREEHCARILQAFEAGIPVAPGSDAGMPGIPHGEGLLSEEAALIRACAGTERTGSDALSTRAVADALQNAVRLVRERFRRQ